MELRDIEYFAVIAEHGHLGRAADVLGLSQPALSKSLRRLEQALQVKLVKRTPKGVELTAEGTVLLLRGSAATLGADDLAAIAKGRHAGIGQAIVVLPPNEVDIAACPIGHAAHVDFPEIGLIQVILARLRL